MCFFFAYLLDEMKRCVRCFPFYWYIDFFCDVCGGGEGGGGGAVRWREGKGKERLEGRWREKEDCFADHDPERSAEGLAEECDRI